MNAIRNTPLHTLAANRGRVNDALVILLVNRGAHLDYVNALGETPADISMSLLVQMFLEAKMTVNLKCLCARLIQQNEIPFRGRIFPSLERFVEKH